MKTALIIGCTGLVGSDLLNRLLASGDYEKVIAFSRSDLEIKHSKLVQHIIDFDKPETYEDLVVGDDFFCAIGTTIKKAGSKKAFKKVDLEYPKQFAAFAMHNNIKQFLIISALGADSQSSNFYLKTKGDIQNYINDCNFESISVLQPSLLLGDRSEFRFGEKVGALLTKLFSFAFIGSLKKYKPIESSTVAKALLKIAQSNAQGFKIYKSDVIQEIGK